ncbi:MAG: hypothetical protein RSC93_10315, partial [Erysipelotrichaceae bacterium]
HSRVDTAHRKHMVETLNNKLSHLLLNGLSIDVALKTLNIEEVSSSTVRRYINKDLLEVKRIDLPSAVRFKAYTNARPNASKLNPRILYKRTYEDFTKYMEANPNSTIVQLDSVIGKSSDKTAILTIYFNNSKFQFAFKYNRKGHDVNSIVANLYKVGLIQEYNLFDVILIDYAKVFRKQYLDKVE